MGRRDNENRRRASGRDARDRRLGRLRPVIADEQAPGERFAEGRSLHAPLARQRSRLLDRHLRRPIRARHGVEGIGRIIKVTAVRAAADALVEEIEQPRPVSLVHDPREGLPQPRVVARREVQIREDGVGRDPLVQGAPPDLDRIRIEVGQGVANPLRDIRG